MFQEPPIYRGSQTMAALDLFKNIGVLPSEHSNLIWTFPQMIEFSMLPFFFADCIPSQHQVVDLEILWFSLSVENIFYPFLG